MDKRIGIYLRVSTIGQSTELQKKEIEAFLKARGNADWLIYEDKLTGTHAMRPALRQLLKDARERKIDTVVCWKMDRLFRSLKDLLTTLQEFSDLGISFISLKDQIDMSTSSGRLLTHLLAAFSEFEASLIKERVIAGLENAKRKGVKLGRPKRINEAEIQRLRGNGDSLSKIARQLGISKGTVSKTLTKLRFQNKLNNPENTQELKSPSDVQKTKDLETPLESQVVNYDLPNNKRS